MNWRWYLFWIKDLLSGGKIYKAYKDIKYSYSNGNLDFEKDINDLLQHASNTTDFYKEYRGKKLEDFPIINKMVIKENFNEIQSKQYKGKKLHKMSTSGSTGTPLTVVQDKNKRARVIAAVIFFGKLCGYTFGQRQMFLRVWVKSVKKSPIKKFIQNMITEDISNLNDSKLEEISTILEKDNKIRNILSYASTLEKLANYLEKKEKRSYGLTSIISGSELLQENVREKLKETFKCNVVSRYANEENGILGQDCIENNHEIHLNLADYYFEFLKLEDDTPAEEGELARIVITDLWNYALPMIRYDTGDLAIVGKAECSLKSNLVIKEIFGRKVDLIYNTYEEPVSPHLITNNMWEVKGIKQFKFIQQDRFKYKILLNLEKDSVCNETDLINKFKKLMGENSEIEIEYTEEIPVLNSGKRKYIENLYRK